MFETTLQSQRAFWSGEDVERPLFGCNFGPNPTDRHPSVMGSLPKGIIKSEDLRVEPFLEDCERLYHLHQEVDLDYSFVGSPFPHLPWTEAIMGCAILCSGTALYAEPCVEDWQRWRVAADAPEGPWGRKLLELMRAVVEHAQGRYPVGATLMRGPADMLAAMRGQSRLPLDFFDCPQTLIRAAEACADVWIQVGKAQLDLIPESMEGYMAGAQAYRMWAPQKAIWLQDDAMASLSPNLYRDVFLPQVRRIAGAFACTGFHMHGKVACGMEQILSQVLSVPELDVMHLSPDSGQGMEDLIPHWKRIREHKRLVLMRPYGEDCHCWLGRILTEVPAGGLSIQVEVNNVAEGRIIKKLFQQVADGRFEKASQ